MRVDEIRNEYGVLIEKTEITELNNIRYFKQYDGKDILLNEWQEVFQPPEPTQEDYFLDLDYRVSMIELGL